MYTIPRIKGASKLGVSTRTLDRYIKDKKIRSKKIGKNVMLHEKDIEALLSTGDQEYSIITDSGANFSHNETANNSIPSSEESSDGYSDSYSDNDVNYKFLYSELKSFSDNQSLTIQKLSYKLGKIETNLNNSIPLLEHKKTSYLLEGEKSEQRKSIKKLENKILSQEDKLKQERLANLLLIICVIVLLLIFGALLYLYLYSS